MSGRTGPFVWGLADIVTPLMALVNRSPCDRMITIVVTVCRPFSHRTPLYLH